MTSSLNASSVVYSGLFISLTTSAILLYDSVDDCLPVTIRESRPCDSSYFPLSAVTANLIADLLAVCKTASYSFCASLSKY